MFQTTWHISKYTETDTETTRWDNPRFEYAYLEKFDHMCWFIMFF